MLTSDLFTLPLILYHPSSIHNKKQAFEAISRCAADWNPHLKYPDILEKLQRREKLGSTHVGHGFAIPHARIAKLKHPLCLVLFLEEPINFGTHETEMVHFILGLLVPEDENPEYLQLLSSLIDKLRDPEFRDQLQKSKNAQTLFTLLKQIQV